MLSPFPGMDPFLEAHWGDVHTSLAVAIRNDLQRRLPDSLVARIEESVLLEAVDDDLPESTRTRSHPDVGHFEPDHSDNGSEQAHGGVAVAEPIISTTRLIPRTQRTVHIYDSGRKMRLVTAIELISPANKIGSKNRETYRCRTDLILESGASLVEIDLIRRGQHVLYCPPIQEIGHYAICVVRAWNTTRSEVYPARFDAPLPTIRIPLRHQDSDAVLELQKLLDRAYIDGDYEDLDYTRKLKPPFSAPENRWLKSQLKKRV